MIDNLQGRDKEKFEWDECILGATLGAFAFAIFTDYYAGGALVIIFGTIIGTVMGLLAKAMKLKRNKYPLCLPLFGIILSVTFVMLPVLASYIACMIANINGCHISSAAPGSCLIFGIDLGNDLYVMKQSIWLGMATFPMGGMAFFIFSLWFLIQLTVILKRKNDRPN